MQLYTRWGHSIKPENVLTEYPREQMKRDSYLNLNGLWDYTVTKDSDKAIPIEWDGQILVPFSPETALSQVKRQLLPSEYLWYHRTLPEVERKNHTDRVLLHFGAVDQMCVVYVNGKAAGEHIGGYVPFSVDITELLRNDSFPNELILRVKDISDSSYYARGKQKLNRGGMYYMATSGIWQTVWMEIVPELYIRDLSILPNIDENSVSIRVIPSSETAAEVSVNLYEPESALGTEPCDAGEQNIVATGIGYADTEIQMTIQNPKLWDTEHPWLYPLRIHLGDDEVISYFALRSIGIEKDSSGLPRICLNHKPIFLRGVLDQGYWPESYYTPPCEEAILFDLTEMKRFGFNMVRKHAKIEPDRWYYHCDRLGLLVWQDIVNGGESYDDWYVTTKPNLWNWKNTKYKTYDTEKTGRRDNEGRKAFKQEMRDTVQFLKNHPSLIAWTLFNEGWGQFELKSCTALLRELDRTRPIDAASGWFDQDEGDFKSVHNYFFPFRIYPESDRAFILSEFGGLPLLLKEHSTCEKLYGYGKRYENTKELSAAYQKLIRKIEKSIPKGLCATVYTQWTDIEDEVNGIYTWDRKVKKIESD